MHVEKEYLMPIKVTLVKEKTVLEFDFIPAGDTISFNYVFGSDEYPELRNRLGGDELKVHNKTEGEDIDYRKFYNSNETLKNISRIYAEDIQGLGYSPPRDKVTQP